jgi:hypothetical protein
LIKLARGIDEQEIKKIIDAIRVKPSSWTDLKDLTNLSDSSLNRYLRYLETWKLIKKDIAGNWCWYENFRTYETEHYYKIALEHSKKLMKTLGGFFGVSMIYPEAFKKQVKQSAKTRDGLFLSAMIREHLRTGSPSLFAKILEFNNIVALRNKIADELTPQKVKIEKYKIVEYVVNFQRLRTYPIPRKYRGVIEKIIASIEPKRMNFIKQVHDNFNESFIQISNELNLLSFKVEHGEPLEGVCDLCPKSKVSN